MRRFVVTRLFCCGGGENRPHNAGRADDCSRRSGDSCGCGVSLLGVGLARPGCCC